MVRILILAISFPLSLELKIGRDFREKNKKAIAEGGMSKICEIELLDRRVLLGKTLNRPKASGFVCKFLEGEEQCIFTIMFSLFCS